MIEVVSPLPGQAESATPGGRLLAKKGISGNTRNAGREGKEGGGEGCPGTGYMVIMQTLDADERRREIEKEGKKVIFSHPFTHIHPTTSETTTTSQTSTPASWTDSGHCIQYHPSLLPGGVIPELDSHTPSPANPLPLQTRFSPWHACGQSYSGEDGYQTKMKRAGGLWLRGVVLRVNGNGEEAAKKWRSLFGLRRSGDGRGVGFTNCEMGFRETGDGEGEGMDSITVGVEGRGVLEGIKERAKKEDVWRDEKGGYMDMLGVKWFLVLMKEGEQQLRARM